MFLLVQELFALNSLLPSHVLFHISHQYFMKCNDSVLQSWRACSNEAICTNLRIPNYLPGLNKLELTCWPAHTKGRRGLAVMQLTQTNMAWVRGQRRPLVTSGRASGLKCSCRSQSPLRGTLQASRNWEKRR